MGYYNTPATSRWYKNSSGTKYTRSFSAFVYYDWYPDYSPTQSLLYISSIGCVKWTGGNTEFVAKSHKSCYYYANIAPASGSQAVNIDKSGVLIDFGSAQNSYVSYGGGYYLYFNKGAAAQSLSMYISETKGANYSGTHAFDGYSEGSFYVGDIPIVSDTISYDLQGGSGSVASQWKQRGVNTTLSTSVPVKQYYTLLGWSETAGKTSKGADDYDIGGTFNKNITSDITLYAIWGQANYNIRFYDGSTLLETKQCSHFSQFDFNTVTPPTSSGKVFTGWSLTNGGEAARYNDTVMGVGSYSADTNYYAVWVDAYRNIQIDNANLRAYRCSNDFSQQDDAGTKAKLIVSYSKGKNVTCNATVADHGITTTDVNLTRAKVSVSTDNETWVEVTSARLSPTIANPAVFNIGDDGAGGVLALENHYYFQVVLYDDAAYTRGAAAESYITKGSFTMDVNANGDAVSFFGVAPDNDTGLFIGDAKVRPIYISANAPTSEDGNDGDVWLQYI